VSSKATTHQELEGAWPCGSLSRVASFPPGRPGPGPGIAQQQRALLEGQKDSAPPLTRKTPCTGPTFRPKRPPSLSRKSISDIRASVSPAARLSASSCAEGQLVAPGMQVVDLVRGDVWIQANYKETQLTNMQQGDVADIPSIPFRGRVARKSGGDSPPADHNSSSASRTTRPETSLRSWQRIQ